MIKVKKEKLKYFSRKMDRNRLKSFFETSSQTINGEKEAMEKYFILKFRDPYF